MDVLRFQQAVRSLVSLAEDLWVQTEVYRGYILETGSISEEELESLTQAVDGHITGAYFEGDGEVLVRPPDRMERASLGLFINAGVPLPCGPRWPVA